MSAEIKFSRFNFQLLQRKSDEATTWHVSRAGGTPQPPARCYRKVTAGKTLESLGLLPPLLRLADKLSPQPPTDQCLNVTAHPTNLLSLITSSTVFPSLPLFYHHKCPFLHLRLLRSSLVICCSIAMTSSFWNKRSTSAARSVLEGRGHTLSQSTHFIPKFLEQSCQRQSPTLATSSYVEAKLCNNCH